MDGCQPWCGSAGNDTMQSFMILWFPAGEANPSLNVQEKQKKLHLFIHLIFKSNHSSLKSKNEISLSVLMYKCWCSMLFWEFSWHLFFWASVELLLSCLQLVWLVFADPLTCMVLKAVLTQTNLHLLYTSPKAAFLNLFYTEEPLK